MITDPVFYVKLTSVWIVLLSIFVVIVKKGKWEKHGKLLFGLFSIPVLLTTLYLAGNTIHHNNISETGGPIHWHADYDIYVCGEKLNLVDPTGFLNKIGSPLLHEHDDHRIHVEGTVTNIEDVNVGAFFKTVGGELTSTSLKYPNNDDRVIKVQNGDLCDGVESELKVYVNGQIIEDPANYMYYPHAGVPPGDCIIIEFGANLPDTTQKMCAFWERNGWTYENFKELRKTAINQPTWRNPNWEYIDGKGMVKTGGNE